MRHDEPETMCSLEWLEHERRKAWQEGYAAGWKDRNATSRHTPPKTHTRRPLNETQPV